MLIDQTAIVTEKKDRILLVDDDRAFLQVAGSLVKVALVDVCNSRII